MEMILPALLGFAVGVAVIYFYMKNVNDSKVTGAKHVAEQIVEDAKREADALKKKHCLKQRMKLTNFVLKRKMTFVTVVENFRNKRTVYCKEKKTLTAKMKL